MERRPDNWITYTELRFHGPPGMRDLSIDGVIAIHNEFQRDRVADNIDVTMHECAYDHASLIPFESEGVYSMDGRRIL